MVVFSYKHAKNCQAAKVVRAKSWTINQNSVFACLRTIHFLSDNCRTMRLSNLSDNGWPMANVTSAGIEIKWGVDKFQGATLTGTSRHGVFQSVGRCDFCSGPVIDRSLSSDSQGMPKPFPAYQARQSLT